jgi:hypothetical protein
LDAGGDDSPAHAVTPIATSPITTVRRSIRLPPRKREHLFCPKMGGEFNVRAIDHFQTGVSFLRLIRKARNSSAQALPKSSGKAYTFEADRQAARPYRERKRRPR